uniref:Uncharacterized protein n=1 Tax=Junco hyemalis TaxID=40217 RepID=A0A8C5JUX6_JUNHY
MSELSTRLYTHHVYTHIHEFTETHASLPVHIHRVHRDPCFSVYILGVCVHKVLPWQLALFIYPGARERQRQARPSSCARPTRPPRGAGAPQQHRGKPTWPGS